MQAITKDDLDKLRGQLEQARNDKAASKAGVDDAKAALAAAKESRDAVVARREALLKTRDLGARFATQARSPPHAFALTSTGYERAVMPQRRRFRDQGVNNVSMPVSCCAVTSALHTVCLAASSARLVSSVNLWHELNVLQR